MVAIPPWVEKSLFWIRCIGSLILYLICTVLIFYCILSGLSTFFPGVPGYVQLIMLIVFFFFLGILEGMQICVIELMKQDGTIYKDNFPNAWQTVKFGLRPHGLERFLMGRQVLVLLLMFFLAKLTTVDGGGLFPDWLENAFLATGLCGALVLTISAQLVPRIIAMNFPVYFINFFIVK
jgi:hypothetical protein